MLGLAQREKKKLKWTLCRCLVRDFETVQRLCGSSSHAQRPILPFLWHTRQSGRLASPIGLMKQHRRWKRVIENEKEEKKRHIYTHAKLRRERQREREREREREGNFQKKDTLLFKNKEWHLAKSTPYQVWLTRKTTAGCCMGRRSPSADGGMVRRWCDRWSEPTAGGGPRCPSYPTSGRLAHCSIRRRPWAGSTRCAGRFWRAWRTFPPRTRAGWRRSAEWCGQTGGGAGHCRRAGYWQWHRRDLAETVNIWTKTQTSRNWDLTNTLTHVEHGFWKSRERSTSTRPCVYACVRACVRVCCVMMTFIRDKEIEWRKTSTHTDEG